MLPYWLLLKGDSLLNHWSDKTKILKYTDISVYMFVACQLQDNLPHSFVHKIFFENDIESIANFQI